MLTKEIVKEVLLQPAKECAEATKAANKDFCFHAEALAANADLMGRQIALVVNSSPDQAEAFIDTFNYGFHAGYRAAQLEQTADAKLKVN